MTLTVECAKQFEGRWFAEVPQLPGVQAYGATRDAATEQALSMVYRVLENERRLGMQHSDTADVYGRESERRLSIVAPDRVAS
jgi:predicted RNase H-like HicB family nuclease